MKNLKAKFKTEDRETVQLKLPENLKEGTYYLKLDVSSKKGMDTVLRPITISNQNTENITCFLDKGIYKPGDKVNYRILSTYKNNDKPIEEDITINIYDGNDNKVYSKALKTSSYGIVSGEFTLADEVNSGTYKIETISNKGKYSKLFTVNPYVTPQFEAKILTDKDYYKKSETASITVDTKYFFGEPVKNAKVTLQIDNKTQEGLTNDEGKYVYEYKFEGEKAEVTINASVIDESNYLVEANKKIYFSDDPFTIEILPEYGNIIKDLDNNIYLFSKNIDGTPIKTYMYIKIGDKLSRQVITDENGVGVITLSKYDLTGLKNTIFKVAARDVNSNQIIISQDFEIQTNKDILINTDKVKYNQGEDIKINLNSSKDIRNTTLAVCKGDRIIKFITTDSDTLVVNLEDTYGIIDIYVTKENNSKTSLKNKRTIFVKPTKELNIDIKLDKTEYTPKENLNMNFNLKDQHDKTVDGALLVSILDEANLSLADNDLSIDNIKLSLSDIKLTENLDAATLYANIIDDKSESSLMSILLKQESKNININNSNEDSVEQKENAKIRLIIGAGITIAIIGIALTIKFKKFGDIIKILITILAVFLCIIAVISEYLTLPKVIVSFIISTILSVTVLKKYKDIVTKWVVFYIWAFIIIAIMSFLLATYDIAWCILAAIVILIALFAIGKIGAKFKKDSIKQLPAEIIKSIIIFIVTILTMVYLEEALDLTMLAVFIGLALFIGLNVLFEIVFYKSKNMIFEKAKISLKNGIIVLSVIAIVILTILGIFTIIKNVYYKIDEPVYDYSNYHSGNNYSGNDLMIIPNDLNARIEYGDSSSSSGSTLNSILDKATDILEPSSKKGIEMVDDEIDTRKENNTEEATTEEEKKNDNIRNVFLESLCFIPELITEDGKATSNMKLSDNITTWKIQVVGNTKDGNIGYNWTNFTVKKDFFIDYTLPTNCIIGDEIKIPVTIYNYTQDEINCGLSVMEKDWFSLGKYAENIIVAPNSTKMVYVPISILKNGNNTLSISANVNDMQDIVEKKLIVQNKGIKKTNVVSSGNMENKLNQDIIYDANAIENTKNLKIKLYPSMISQVVEGLESIFKMPTGCFEQTASSLYPDIVVLKYMEDNKIIDDELKNKALSYISAGYQKTLTYEVQNEKGGFSLYGKSPANPILTAYGLMELIDASEVYEVDENVINRMKDYLYKKQEISGSFDTKNSYSSVVSSRDDLTLDTYIIWALTEADPNNSRIEKSVKYVEDNLDKMTDNYTIALAANIFTNVGNTKQAKNLLNKLEERLQGNDKETYLQSNTVDYYGTRGNTQNIQTSALTSMAISKLNDASFNKTNEKLINYIISKKDQNGNWYTTQATIFALKALTKYQTKSDISNQTIKVILNGDTKEIKVEENSLSLYEVDFASLGTENNLKIEMEKGKIYYEIIEEYYQDVETAKNTSNNKIQVATIIPQNVKLNEITNQEILIKNTSGEEIINGMVEITIPQGFKVQEEALSKLVVNGQIEKYEYNYSKIYLYIQNFENEAIQKLQIQYRPMYPGTILGSSIRCYDYYNPDIEGISMPVEINISE